MSFRPALEKIKDDFQEALKDGKFCVHEYLQLAADSCEVLEKIPVGIGGDDVQFNQLVSDCEGIVQEYVIPLDLTKFKIPPFIERFVIDPQLPMMIRPALEAMRPKPHAEE